MELNWKRISNNTIMAIVQPKRGKKYKRGELRTILTEISNNLDEESRTNNKNKGKVGMQLHYEGDSENAPAIMTDFGEQVKLFDIEDSSDRFTKSGEIKMVDSFVVFVHQ